MATQQNGYLGSSFGAPTDPNYYLGQTGLQSLVPQAFNANSLSSMFSPQGMQWTPVNEQATNPFESMFLGAMRNIGTQKPQPSNGMPTTPEQG